MAELNTFLDRLLQFVPEDKKAEARSVYSAASDRATVLERGVQTIQDTGRQQADWWNKNKDVVAERDQLSRDLAAAREAQPVVDQNAIERAIAASSAQTLETGLGLVAAATTIGTSHVIEFGEQIDMTKLITDAIAAKVPLDQFYNSTVAQRRTEKSATVTAAREASIRAEGVAAGKQEVMDQVGKSRPERLGGHVGAWQGTAFQKGHQGLINLQTGALNASGHEFLRVPSNFL